MAAVTHPTPLPSDVATPGSYRPWHLRREADVDVPGGWLKWYELAPGCADRTTISRTCRFVLADLIATGQAPVDGQVGFVTLVVEPNQLSMSVFTWQHEDELWRAQWALRPDESPTWQQVEASSTHRSLVGSVQELLPIGFERDAWVRFLRSNRTANDLARYRSATMEGAG